ncbi:MAG: hypothetical protein Crog4KO_00570 [Crocinitomicaceae bacterium]
MKILICLLLFIKSYSFAQTNEQFIEWVKRKCDRQIELRLGEENFKNHVLQNIEQSNVECIDGSNFTLSSDSIDCKINAASIVYDIFIDEIKIYTITFVSDSIGNINCLGNSDWRYDLNGYKELINRNFPIDYKRACQIVKDNNYEPSEYEFELVHADPNIDDLKAYEWRGGKYLGNKITKAIYVNAFTGEFNEVLIQDVSDEN